MKKKIFSTILLSIILLMSFTLTSNAAMQIIPGTETSTGITISDTYAYCYNLRTTSSTLGNNTLDPHLSTGYDWGAVAYLAASVYGCNMNSTSLTEFKTSGNNSGVMNFGKTGTYVSVITDSNFTTQKNLINYKNTKYVNYISGYYVTGDGIATNEIANWGSKYSNLASTSNNAHQHIRYGILGCYYGYANGNSATFRPAIWN